jgi:NAD(P)-dependent dehydrogenase (short-subunit alcohol dehydrogenase family)
MGRLTDKSILITGASSGIGRAIALRFAAEGAKLMLVDLSTSVREGGTPTIDLLRELGCVADHVDMDVSSEADVQKAVDLLVARDGRIDVLVNDAATSVGKPLTETSLDEWNRVLGVNLTGVFLMSRAAVRAMLEQDPRDGVRGRIVNISSQHGMVACPQDVAYGTSKAGVVYITRQVAVDYAPHGIICNAVAPGKILTSHAPLYLALASRTTWPVPRCSWPVTRPLSSPARTYLSTAAGWPADLTGEHVNEHSSGKRRTDDSTHRRQQMVR